MVTDAKIFIDKLKVSLIELGIKDNEILYDDVSYPSSNFKAGSWLEVPKSSPYELFYKDKKRYKEQEDINTPNNDAVARLNYYPNPILMGDLSSCTKKFNYPLDGLVLKGQIEAIKIRHIKTNEIHVLKTATETACGFSITEKPECWETVGNNTRTTCDKNGCK